jgi:hypothetical protein
MAATLYQYVQEQATRPDDVGEVARLIPQGFGVSPGLVAMENYIHDTVYFYSEKKRMLEALRIARDEYFDQKEGINHVI